KSLGPASSRRLRYGLALGAGLLQGAAFPTIGLTGLAWLAPGLILLLAAERSVGTRFRIGFYAGLGNYLLSLLWLLLIPMRAQAWLAWLAVSSILALYTGVWTWVCWKIFPVRATPPEEREPRPPKNLLQRVSWTERALWAFFSACAWVAMEMAIGRLFTGF